MRTPDLPEDLDLLSRYLARSVALGDKGVRDVLPRIDVTCLMYFFWDQADAARRWPTFEGALLETWRHCGLLKAIVVVDSNCACVNAFANRFSNVEIQIEPSLVPGDINTMSVDCNVRLADRFDTDYVLIVQNDGFPLRRGLDRFVQLGFDFYGAPHCRPKVIPSLLTRLARYCPSNGGFSLRTRKLCRLAARLWRDGDFEHRPFVEDVIAEDYFYTRTLPLSGFRYWSRRSQASSVLSDRFSYGATFPFMARELPFGFHTATAFARLNGRYGLLS